MTRGGSSGSRKNVKNAKDFWDAGNGKFRIEGKHKRHHGRRRQRRPKGRKRLHKHFYILGQQALKRRKKGRMWLCQDEKLGGEEARLQKKKTKGRLRERKTFL